MPPIKVNNDIIVDDKEKAEAFNIFFTSAANLNDDNANLPNLDPFTDNRLERILVLEQDVYDQLSTIDVTKSYGADEISPRFLKEGREYLSRPLCRMFNLSLQFCKFPSLWKKANIIPLHKKDDRDICGNYRPVSLLSANSKVFERIVFKYVFNFFKENFLISIWQSGFLPGSSTITQLIEIYHKFCQAVSDGKDSKSSFLGYFQGI